MFYSHLIYLNTSYRVAGIFFLSPFLPLADLAGYLHEIIMETLNYPWLPLTTSSTSILTLIYYNALSCSVIFIIRTSIQTIIFSNKSLINIKHLSLAHHSGEFGARWSRDANFNISSVILYVLQEYISIIFFCVFFFFKYFHRLCVWKFACFAKFDSKRKFRACIFMLIDFRVCPCSACAGLTSFYKLLSLRRGCVGVIVCIKCKPNLFEIMFSRWRAGCTPASRK